MYKILSLAAIALLFTSCTSKNSAFRYFEKTDLEAKATKYTKKTDIVKNEEVDTTFFATYLNKIEKNFVDENYENFLVYTYFSNQNNQDLEENGFTLNLENNEPIEIEEIEKDSEKFKDLMLKNYWGKYYFVKFNKIEKSKFNLILQKDQPNKAILNFAK